MYNGFHADLKAIAAGQFQPVSQLSALRQSASRQGITRESIGGWHNLAVRFGRQGNAKEAAECYSKALWVLETFGRIDEAFGCSEHCEKALREGLARHS